MMSNSHSRIAALVLLTVALGGAPLVAADESRHELTAVGTAGRSYIDAQMGGPYYADVNVTITMTATLTGGINPYHWTWNFNDDTASATGTTQESTITVSHSWAEEGDYNISLSVYDDYGNAGGGGDFVYIWSGYSPIADRSWGRIKALFR
ncbi:MAG: PKD domain-containing protein [Candidatus Eisenbacteria bacterium]|nr:PKD domain-containing protein [Candidatus Eisenbacteria bacterium]